eukprot:762730-Hanusia_phi.AAC.1
MQRYCADHKACRPDRDGSLICRRAARRLRPVQGVVHRRSSCRALELYARRPYEDSSVGLHRRLRGLQVERA